MRKEEERLLTVHQATAVDRLHKPTPFQVPPYFRYDCVGVEMAKTKVCYAL